MLDDEGSASPEQIRLALQNSATPIGAVGPCAVGAGLVDAVGAMSLLQSGEPGSPTPPCEPPESPPWKTIDQGGTVPPAIPPDTTSTPTDFAVPTATAEKRSFRRAPTTFFHHRPPTTIRTRHRTARVVFRFASNRAGVSFLCQWDRRRYRKCPARFARRFGLGRHVLRVKARDAAGNADRTPAVHRFRVKRSPKSR